MVRVILLRIDNGFWLIQLLYCGLCWGIPLFLLLRKVGCSFQWFCFEIWFLLFLLWLWWFEKILLCFLADEFCEKVSVRWFAISFSSEIFRLLWVSCLVGVLLFLPEIFWIINHTFFGFCVIILFWQRNFSMYFFFFWSLWWYFGLWLCCFL